MSDDPREDPCWEQVRAAADLPVPTPPGLVERVLRSVGGLTPEAAEPPSEDDSARDEPKPGRD